MQLHAMKYARIEGTEVIVEVKTMAEGKVAIKELRHKKKEVALLKRRLAIELKRARALEDRLEKAAVQRERRKGLMGALTRLSHAFKDDDQEAAETVARLEKDLERLEEITHNIDSCIIQIEGKLLA